MWNVAATRDLYGTRVLEKARTLNSDSIHRIPILVLSLEYFVREHCLSLYPDLECAC